MNETVPPDASAPEKDFDARLAQHLELLRQGIVAARANDKGQARSLLLRAIAIQNDQEVTWLWLASVVRSRSDFRTCMEQVLRINPGNQRAGDWLRKARALSTPRPAAETAQAPPTVEPDPPKIRPLPTTLEPGRPKVILVVDDSPTVRKLVAVTLEHQGYRVVSAADGMKALAKLQDVIPDLILLDIAMPHLDGYKICKVIRANDLTCDVPVVMLSGKGGFFDKVRGRLAGAVDYITKPFEPQALLRILEKNLQDRDG